MKNRNEDMGLILTIQGFLELFCNIFSVKLRKVDTKDIFKMMIFNLL